MSSSFFFIFLIAKIQIFNPTPDTSQLGLQEWLINLAVLNLKPRQGHIFYLY